MKTIVLTKYGTKENLRENFEYALLQTPYPPSSTEVTIQVHAASINPVDLYIATGGAEVALKGKTQLPFPLGRDCAGVVVDIGKNVKKFKIGDKVFGINTIFQNGTHCDYVKIEESQIYFAPNKLSMIESASLAFTGFISASSHDYIPTGGEVFINGGSGGIGSCLIPLAKQRNCKVHVSCSPHNFEYVYKLGADFVYDYKDFNYFSHLKESQINIYFDTLPIVPKVIPFIVQSIAPNGSYLNLHPSRLLEKPTVMLAIKRLFDSDFRKFNKKNITNGIIYPDVTAPQAYHSLSYLNTVLEENIISPHIAKVFPLNKAIDAFEYFISKKEPGKVVIDFTSYS